MRVLESRPEEGKHILDAKENTTADVPIAWIASIDQRRAKRARSVGLTYGNPKGVYMVCDAPSRP